MPVYSVEAPVGGWNARDAQDNLPESDALELVNLIPREGYVESRGGTNSFYLRLNPTGDAYFDTLAVFDSGGTQHMLAADDGPDINRVLPTFANLGGTFTGTRWQHAMTHGRLILVNGSDAPQEYDGSTLSAISGIGGSGLTVSDLIGVMPFKGRVFYWEDNATSFWYPGAGEYKNASMSEYEMNQFLTRGGTLTLAFTWTLDGGAGMDDLAVFVFSTGETLVYQGSDPGSASDWALVGRFQIGEPLGKRAHCRFGSDHIVLTRDGYERISFSLQAGRGKSDKLSDKISGAVKDAIESYGDNEGWEVTYYAKESLILVNVPVDPDAGSFFQHVLNINTGSWCKWDIGGYAWAVYADELYCGTGVVGAGPTASCDIFKYSTDYTDDNGDAITYDCTQIVNFGDKARRKQLTGINFITTYQSPESIGVTTAADFNTPATPSVSGTDNTPSSTVTQQWKVVAQAGYAVTYSMRVIEEGQPWKWYATQMTYKVGGPV